MASSLPLTPELVSGSVQKVAIPAAAKHIATPQKTSAGVDDTVLEYVRLVTVGAMIRVMACRNASAPSNSPVCSLPTIFVMLASEVDRPMAPKAATAPESVNSVPVGARA